MASYGLCSTRVDKSNLKPRALHQNLDLFRAIGIGIWILPRHDGPGEIARICQHAALNRETCESPLLSRCLISIYV